jgi:hypothetical protein
MCRLRKDFLFFFYYFLHRWQRQILNLNTRGKLWPQGRSCTPGVNFVPWGWSYLLGVKFSVCPSIILNSRECSPLGVNKGVNIPPRVQISLLGARGEVKNGPQGDQIGRKFASPIGWLFSVDRFLKSTEVAHTFWPLFSYMAGHFIYQCITYFWQTAVGLHFGRFFHKLIWSPWQVGT